MKRILLAVICLGSLVIIGCGTHGRYNPNNKYGDVVSSKQKDLVANYQTNRGDGAKAEQAKKKVVAWGKELFNDASLGSNGQSCNSCHPGGGTTGGEARIKKKMGHGPYALPIPNLVGAASRFPKYKVPNGQVVTLQQMNNNCVRMFMGGKRMPLDSPESIALAAFVTSLSAGEAVDVHEESGR